MVAVGVPTIDKRKRIPQKAIDQVVEQIVENFQPQKIILFGSYARGNPRPESDVDMLVVMDTPLREIEQSLEIYRRLNVMFGLDLIVYTPKHLQERLKMHDWFLIDVVKEGKVVYIIPTVINCHSGEGGKSVRKIVEHERGKHNDTKTTRGIGAGTGTKTAKRGAGATGAGTGAERKTAKSGTGATGAGTGGETKTATTGTGATGAGTGAETKTATTGTGATGAGTGTETKTAETRTATEKIGKAAASPILIYQGGEQVPEGVRRKQRNERGGDLRVKSLPPRGIIVLVS